jgi:hypothetical protein
VRFVPWLVVTAIAAIASACFLPSEGEFTSGYVPPDAGKDSGGPKPTEAGVPPPDGSTPTDAGTDAPAGFCPRTAVYCNDFSSGSPSDIGSPSVSNGASLTVENGVLESKLPEIPGAGSYGAAVVYSLPLNAAKVVVEVDVVVSQADWTGGNLVVLGVYYNGQPQNHAFELYVSGDYSSITTSENDKLIYDNATQPLPRGKSVHVKIETDFTPHQGSFAVSYDGTRVISHDGPIDFTANSITGFKVVVGMTRSNYPTPAITTTYDNLVITLP